MSSRPYRTTIKSASDEVMFAARALRAARRHLSQASTLHPLPHRERSEARLRAWVRRLDEDVRQLVAMAVDFHMPKPRRATEPKQRRAA